MTDTALNNPIVTAVLAIKNGGDVAALSSTAPMPISVINGGAAVSASNPLPVLTKPESVLVATGTLGAANGAVTIAVTPEFKTASMFLTDGNLSGTIEMQYSVDSGTTYNTLLGRRLDNNSSNYVFSPNGTGVVGKAFEFPIPIGCTNLKSICTAYTSGSSTAKITLSSTSKIQQSILALDASANRIGFTAASQMHWLETIAALNSNQVFTGTWRNCMIHSSGNVSGNTTTFGKQFSTSAFSDQPFDLYIEISEDQSRIRRWHKMSATLVGSVYGAELTITPRAVYARVVIVCGGTNMTYLDCHSNQLAN